MARDKRKARGDSGRSRGSAAPGDTGGGKDGATSATTEATGLTFQLCEHCGRHGSFVEANGDPLPGQPRGGYYRGQAELAIEFLTTRLTPLGISDEAANRLAKAVREALLEPNKTQEPSELLRQLFSAFGLGSLLDGDQVKKPLSETEIEAVEGLVRALAEKTRARRSSPTRRPRGPS